MSTSPGERVHRYDYGCPIRRYVFEIIDISTQTLLRDEIERAVVMFEPRVDLNRRTNMVYPFYLNEGTDLTGL